MIRRTTIEIRDESYWKIKSSMAKLGLKKWIDFMDVLAKILEDILSNEENYRKYKEYAKQVINKVYNKKIIEEETTGSATPMSGEANHDNK